jgi:hypothetical protein
MRGRVWRSTCLAVVASLALAGQADGDSIAVKASVGTDQSHVPVPSLVTLTTEAQASGGAFVGAVVFKSAVSSCPANYGQAISEGGASSVTAQTRTTTGTQLTGSTVTLPVGTYSLCGWVQPEGDTPAARASAMSGPQPFTVGGPVGSTAVHAPPTTASEQVQIPVSYVLTQRAGDIPGLTSARIGAWADRGGVAACSAGEGLYSTSLTSTGTTALTTSQGGPVEGQVVFGGRLIPGEYEVCSYLQQTFPWELGAAAPGQAYGILAATLPGPWFGIGEGTMRVLTHPLISLLRVRPEVLRLTGTARRAPVWVRYTLNEQAVVSFAISRLVRHGGARGSHTCLSDPVGHRRTCGVLAPVGVLHQSEGAGPDRLRFAGRVGGRKLPAGVYEIAAVARSQDGAVSPSEMAVFAVL